MRRVPPGTPIVTAAGMRAAEQRAFDAGVAQAELMERAGTAVAHEVARFASGRPVLVLAGPGDNGGDGYVAARWLRAHSHDVCVAALGEPKAGAAAAMAARWEGETVAFATAPPRPVLVDGLFGTGVTRPLDPTVASRLDALAAAAEFRIAIDLPSGIATDTGDGAAIAADVTVALGALKPAHLIAPAAARCGHVLLADIGVPVASDWTSLAVPRLTRPRDDAHKYSRGMVAVVGGAMPGAARLAAGAALHGGAGYVLLAERAAAEAAPHAVVRRAASNAADLEALLADDRIGAVVIGCGLGRDERAAALLDVALASRHPLVLDGDALTLLGRDVAQRIASHRRRVVLTPHAGEFDRMFDLPGSKIDRTLAAAALTGATVVHKGADTVIADARGRVVVAGGATPWLSTAGTGDVLAGLIGARVAGCDARSAAADAVWLHARAAALAGIGFAADDLIPQLSRALAECEWT